MSLALKGTIMPWHKLRHDDTAPLCTGGDEFYLKSCKEVSLEEKDEETCASVLGMARPHPTCRHSLLCRARDACFRTTVSVYLRLLHCVQRELFLALTLFLPPPLQPSLSLGREGKVLRSHPPSVS